MVLGRLRSRSNMPDSSRKDLSIQSLRGLALILMVAGHVIGIGPDRGMQVADDSAWRYLYLALEDIRMPLFTLISGYVYALRPLAHLSGYPQLVRAKSRRLLLPMATVGTMLFVAELVVPGTNYQPDPTDYWRIYVFGFEHLWFLQAIFLIFLVVGLLDARGLLARPRSWAVATGASLVLLMVLQVPDDADIFSVNEAIYLLPYFLLGYGLSRHRALSGRRLLLPVLLAVFAVAFSAKVMVLTAAWHPGEDLDRALGMAVGISGVLSIYLLRHALRFPWLVWLGQFSFCVYLLHPFGAVAARQLLDRLGVDGHVPVFVVALAVGVAAPVVFQLLFARFRLVRTGILGEKWSPRAR